MYVKHANAFPFVRFNHSGRLAHPTSPVRNRFTFISALLPTTKGNLQLGKPDPPQATFALHFNMAQEPQGRPDQAFRKEIS